MEKRSLKAMREEFDKQLVVEEVKTTSPFAKLQALSHNIDEMTETFSQEIGEIAVGNDSQSESKPRNLTDILANVEQLAGSLDEDIAAIFEKKGK